ncbi:hypothetical protein BDZ97DRAFT_2074736 [Flammula alnicola]|nr:hypothetical protein BDZ97DRAFT_2074736 [Flammula alnicola]
MCMRPLAKTDHSRSHLSVLSVLTSTPELSVEQYEQAFATLLSCPNTYYTLVIVSRETDSIVGVGSVFLEQKFTRNLGRVGHIEDIAVDKSMQGRKLGLRVIQALTGISEKVGCYKTILNCSDANIREYCLFFCCIIPLPTLVAHLYIFSLLPEVRFREEGERDGKYHSVAAPSAVAVIAATSIPNGSCIPLDSNFQGILERQPCIWTSTYVILAHLDSVYRFLTKDGQSLMDQLKLFVRYTLHSSLFNNISKLSSTQFIHLGKSSHHGGLVYYPQRRTASKSLPVGAHVVHIQRWAVLSILSCSATVADKLFFSQHVHHHEEI